MISPGYGTIHPIARRKNFVLPLQVPAFRHVFGFATVQAMLRLAQAMGRMIIDCRRWLTRKRGLPGRVDARKCDDADEGARAEATVAQTHGTSWCGHPSRSCHVEPAPSAAAMGKGHGRDAGGGFQVRPFGHHCHRRYRSVARKQTRHPALAARPHVSGIKGEHGMRYRLPCNCHAVAQGTASRRALSGEWRVVDGWFFMYRRRHESFDIIRTR